MEMTIKVEGVERALAALREASSNIAGGLTRSLHRIGGLWKRTAVEYSPISPTSSMLNSFAKRLKAGGEFADRMYVPGRKGGAGSTVRLTAFYQFRLNSMVGKNAKKRPMPGGLMRSITMRSTDSLVEVFVPANSPAGQYAFKIHEEKGIRWKERGPGTQAKGPQADDKFITRAATDKRNEFRLIVESEIAKALQKGGSNG